MTDRSFTFNGEMRRHVWLGLSLAGAALVSTFMVVNGRALFLPPGQIPDGDIAQAYAVFTNVTYGPHRGGSNGRHRGPRKGLTPEPPPVAYAFRVPNEPEIPGFTPTSGPLTPGNIGPLDPMGPTGFGSNPPGFSSPPGSLAPLATPRNGGGGNVPPGTPDPVPAVPEPSSWAMMILGFAILGGAMRYKRHRRLALSGASA